MPRSAVTPHLSNPHGVSRGTLAAGARVGGANYVLKRMLGRGGFSEVWLAWDRKLEQDVALKFLPQTLLENAAMLDHLQTEIARSQRLEHPAIARVHGLVQDSESIAIATEYVEGWSVGTLKVDRPEKRYEVSEIEPWVRQICAALEYAHHEICLVHRDLKPSNILLNAREQVKLTDFAVAHIVRTALAQQGHLVYGAVAYMSPQQLKGAEASVLDDLYSLGATIYDLLTGTPPFHKGEILAQVCELTAPSMTERLGELELRSSIPSFWEETIERCLAKDPAARPQSASELWRWLESGQVPRLALPPSLKSEPSTTNNAPPSEPEKSAQPSSIAAATAETTTAETTTLPAPSETEPAETDESGQIFEPSIQLRPGRKAMVVVLAAVMLLTMLLGLSGAWWLRSKKAAQANLRTGPPGSLDTSFHPGVGADNDVRALLAQPDGKILIGGKFAYFDGTVMKGFGRLSADGRPETNFSASINGAVHVVALQPDGKIVVGGDFMKVNEQSRRRIARLKPDGGLDTTFDPKGALNREARALLVQPDGKILAGGSFDASSGHHQNRITRFNPDGSRDTTFSTSAGANGTVWALCLQPDGKILVGGDFTRCNASPHARIARLNSDGTLDSSFSCGSGANASVLAFCLQPDGKIIVAGSFGNLAGLDRSRIARMHPDGSVDSTFNSTNIPKGSLRSLALQPDGKIVIAGALETVQGIPRAGIARLNSDGSLDQTFDPGRGATDGSLWRVSLASEGKFLIGGVFRDFNGVASGCIARLNGDPTKPR